MDRAEFEKVLNSMYKSKVFYDYNYCIEALINQDQEKIDEIKINYQKANNLINHYLNQYDIAENDKQKNQILGAISCDLDKTPFSL